MNICISGEEATSTWVHMLVPTLELLSFLQELTALENSATAMCRQRLYWKTAEIQAYIYRVVWVNTLCLCHERHRNKLPWRYPSFSDKHSPVEQLFWNPPENNSPLSVAIILHVLLTEANVGIAQWVLQLSFIPKAIISVFSLSKSPGMRKFTIICIYSWTGSL